jgi:hypothetical protein
MSLLLQLLVVWSADLGGGTRKVRHEVVLLWQIIVLTVTRSVPQWIAWGLEAASAACYLVHGLFYEMMLFSTRNIVRYLRGIK